MFSDKHGKGSKTEDTISKNRDYDENDDDFGTDELSAYSEAIKRRILRQKTRKRRLIAFAVLVIAALFVFLNWGTLSPTVIAESTQSFFSGFGKSKFPVDFSEGTMKTAVPVGSNIGILTDTSFLIYSQNGDQVAVRPHGINNPAAVSGGGKALIYDRGGTQFRVEARYSEPFSTNASYNITTAAMGSNGYFAIVTEAENYLSELTVYDNSYKNIFKWDSSKGHILTASISPDGSKLAAVVIGARNGNMFSDIYIFNLSSSKPSSITKYDGELFYSINFKDNNHIAAVGDDEAVFLYSSGKQISKYGYGGRELKCSSNLNGPVVLVFNKSGTESSVVSLDNGGNLLGNTDVAASEVSIISNGDGKTVIVSNGQILYTSDNCKDSGKISVSGAVMSVISMKNYAYVFGTQSIGRYKLN